LPFLNGYEPFDFDLMNGPPWVISVGVRYQFFSAIFILISFLMGSIPFGLIFVRCFTRKDIRKQGSGNIGATNVRRAAGTSMALLVLICDVLKGALPVLATGWMMSRTTDTAWIVAIAAQAAILGHMFPVFLKFKPSGKGVATALGVFGVLSPIAVLAGLGMFIILVTMTRRASVGSLGGAATLIPAVWLTTFEPSFTLSATLTAVLIFLRHKDNIERLLQGREPTINLKDHH
jgi:glycerol-3-phosphate acyltransferase PlsY